jgi:uncharacterized membrane protein (UPF0136 family)
MKYPSYVVLAYGIFILAGGMIGYVKAHSIPSIVMGISFATALITSGVAMLKGNIKGFYGSMVLVLILTGFFSYRLFITQHFMPSGFLALLSMIVFVILATRRKQKVHS